MSPEEPVAAAALAVDPAALALAEEEAVAVFPSTLDCTYTHREHNAHARRGKKRGEIFIITELHSKWIDHHGR